jgi:hypothetical protein
MAAPWRKPLDVTEAASPTSADPESEVLRLFADHGSSLYRFCRMTLHGALDDATGAVLALHFRPTEDLHGYATLFAQVFATHGLPVACYGDGTAILVRTDDHWSLDEELRGTQDPTHLGRVLAELGIGYIRAHSPQAKGRIERLWRTLQDRLRGELRLRGIHTPAAANAVLPDFLADYNRRFAQAPTDPTPAWRRPPRDLALQLSCRYVRTVARDNTVRLGPRWLQLPPGPGGRSHAGRRVEVESIGDLRRLPALGNGCPGHHDARDATRPRACDDRFHVVVEAGVREIRADVGQLHAPIVRRRSCSSRGMPAASRLWANAEAAPTSGATSHSRKQSRSRRRS